MEYHCNQWRQRVMFFIWFCNLQVAPCRGEPQWEGANSRAAARLRRGICPTPRAFPPGGRCRYNILLIYDTDLNPVESLLHRQVWILCWHRAEKESTLQPFAGCTQRPSVLHQSHRQEDDLGGPEVWPTIGSAQFGGRRRQPAQPAARRRSRASAGGMGGASPHRWKVRAFMGCRPFTAFIEG